MKKLFLIPILTLGVVLGVASCGGNDELIPAPDLSVKDAAILTGVYTGTVEAYLTDFKVKDTVRQAEKISLTTSSVSKLIFGVTEPSTLKLGAMQEGECWHNFNYTAAGSKDITNTIGTYTRSWADASTVPAYVTQWLSATHGTINSASFELSKSSAKYTDSNKQLVFDLPGILKVNHTVTAGGQAEDKSFKIIYKFKVTKN